MGGIGDWMSGLISPGSSEGSYQQLPKYTQEQQNLLNMLIKKAQTGMEGPAPSSPDAFVPLTSSEQMLTSLAPQFQAYAQGELPYKIGDAYVDDYMKAYQPIWERARNEAMDLARAEYAGPTYWGQARAKGLGDIASQWGEKYAMTEADLRLQEEQRRREAIDKYIGVGTEGLQTTGGIERNVQEQKVMSDLNKFLRGEEVGGKYDPIYNQNMQLALSLLGISPYEYGGLQETSGPGAIYSFTFPFGGGSGGTQISSGILGALA